MNHNFYYRLLVFFTLAISSSLFLPDVGRAQSSNSNWNWNCDSCNDGNPCTVDYCIFGFCVNVPIRNCGNDYDCELKIVQAKTLDCYYDVHEQKSKVKLRVSLWWRNAPTNKDIKVWINGQQKIVDVTSPKGGAMVEFILAADGSQNHKVWAEFLGEGSCKDQKTYHLPPACAPAPCDLEITDVTLGNCYYDAESRKSKAKLEVCVEWKNRPDNELIFVSLENGDIEVIYPLINQKNGSKCVTFIVDADGSTNNSIWTSFPYRYHCRDEAKYNAPQPCPQLPPCDLDIVDVGVSECYYDPYDNKSKARVNICVEWNNRPLNDNIVVQISGQSQVIYPTASSGTQCVEFTIPANGTANNGIWAKFQNKPACQDEAFYKAPAPCPPNCDLDITSVQVSQCYYDAPSHSSKAKLTICLKWNNRPGNENIMVSINGQTKSITPSANSGTACVEFIIPANGSSHNGIWAKFQYTAHCQDESKYHAPQPCQQQPQCDLDITNVYVSDCYFDSGDHKSKAKLTVCVKWKNRPGNENIMVQINGQSKTIATSTSEGSKCVEFIIPANGSANNGIWAKFQYTPSCQDEAKYHAPQPCYQTPQCDLDITSVQVGNCYYDSYSQSSKVKLIVCVKWNNRPNHENIMVSTGGQTKTIVPNAASGSVCVEFHVPANGSYNNFIWAKFQYSASCQDEAKYHAPQPCYQAPQCDLDITSVSVGSCYYDSYEQKSKVKLTVCVQWQNRPANEHIIVSINGQSKTIVPNGTSGSACVEFHVLANGTANNGIWAKFQYTQSCQDEAFYHVPQPCQPLPQCDLDITSVTVGNCEYDHYNQQSKVKLTICVKWQNRPTNENIMVSINGQSKTIVPNGANGSACVDFIVTANGSYNNNIWAKFQYTSSCQDEATYHLPQPCYEAPECELNIKSVTVGNCYYDHYDYKSKAKLTICVEWKNRPNNENIVVSINGQSKTIVPGSASGSACVDFIILSNGIHNNGIWAKFQYSSYCQDEAFYHAPNSCYEAPPCELDITSVSVGNCYYDQYSNSSKAKVTVCVNWKNRPGNENIIVTLGGQSRTIYTDAYTGSQCVDFTVPANGSANNGIWAKFQYSTSCQDEAKYHAPQSCQPLPQCDLDITEVSVGNCYYDSYGNASKAKLKICVSWKNRPNNERIMVSINGQSQTITPPSTNGSACVEFTIPANGVYNNGIWAKFEYSQSCQDEAFYHAPQPCYQAPQCDLDITSVSVGNCYYDSYEGKSKVKLTICVKWKNRPNNENIYVSIDGQSKVIYPGGPEGSACVEFVVNATGSYNNGIWAKFQYTQSCQDEAFYHLPQPCYQAPQCKLDIYKVELSQCYVDHYDHKSKAKLKVCIEWQNAPTDEKIKLTINGQGKLIAFSAPNGSVCVEFIISANGVHNNGIWAKFEYTQSCQDEAFYNAPYPCNSYSNRAADTNQPAEVQLDKQTTADEVATDNDDVTVRDLGESELDTKPAAAPLELRVFPNPARHELNVDMTAFAGKTAQVQVFNTLGQVMYQATLDEVATDKLQLDVSQFAGEVYFLKVHIANEGTYTKTFIVTK